MTNMISADLYRISHKKNNYMFFLILFSIFTIMMLLSVVATATDNNFITPYFLDNAIYASLQLGTLFISAHSFITVYYDDISSGYIKHIVSKNPNKFSYIFSKFITLAVHILLSYLILGIIFYVEMYIFSKGFYSNKKEYIDIILSSIYPSFITYVATVLYAMSGSIVLYLFSKISLATLWIVFLASSIASNLLLLLTHIIKPLKIVCDYTIDTVILKLIHNGFDTKMIFALFLYLILSLFLQILLINKKELKFD